MIETEMLIIGLTMFILALSVKNTRCIARIEAKLK